MRTHGIGVIAYKAADPWSEPHTFTDHLEDVDSEEKKQGDCYAHEAVGWTIAFKLCDEQLHALD